MPSQLFLRHRGVEAFVGVLALAVTYLQVTFTTHGAECVQSVAFGLPLVMGFRFGFRALVPFVAGSLLGLYFRGVRVDVPSLLAAVLELVAMAIIIRRWQWREDISPTITAVRLIGLATGLALFRGFIYLALSGFGVQIAKEDFFVVCISDWLASVTLLPFFLYWTLPTMWQDWSFRRTIELIALCGGAALGVLLIGNQDIQDDFGLFIPVTVLFLCLIMGLIARLELLGIAVFLLVSAVLFGYFCSMQMELEMIEVIYPPRLTRSAALLGAVHGMLWVVTASWAERRLVSENREKLLEEVQRQRDELQRLSVESASREAFLESSQARLQAIMRTSGLLLWDYRLKADELNTSEPIETWFHFPTTERVVSLARALEFTHPDDLARVQATIAATIAGTLPEFEFPHRVPQADGSVRTYLTRGRLLENTAEVGDPTYTGVTIDITQQKSDEQRLHLLESAVVHARDAIVILEAAAKDLPGRRVLYINDAFTTLTGYDRDEVVGRTLHMLRGPDSDSATLVQLREALDASLPLQVELLNYRKDQTTFWVELSLVPVPDADGSCSFWVMIQRDISDRKRSEQILRDRDEQLRQAQKMETVGQLAGGVAHDFNNLLTAVIGNLCLVKLPTLDPNRKLLAVAERAAQRAADLTSKLLGFARRNQLLLKPLPVREFVEEVVDLLRRTIDPRIEIRMAISDETMNILADETLLNQVLLNLCLNARDAMPEGGLLSIRADAVEVHESPRVRISVADTGTGMTPEVKARLFEPFFTTKPIGQGTGLGLAMVDGIIKQHKGFVECETELGQGTTFHLYLATAETAEALPRSSLVTRAKSDPMIDLTLEDTPMPNLHPNATILLVDDEEMIRTLARVVLESAGHTVIEATDGQEAVEIFREQHATLDLIILDLMMPRLSGRDACKLMTQLQPSAKILLSSGYSTDDVSDLAGALGLLSKPYRPKELIAAVESALASQPEMA
jgi:PAS domain S-box-containing protein